jgi:hypothetical protein
MEFLRHSSVLPVPLNIIPTPSFLILKFKRIFFYNDYKKRKAEKLNKKFQNSVTNNSASIRKEEDLSYKVKNALFEVNELF